MEKERVETQFEEQFARETQGQMGHDVGAIYTDLVRAHQQGAQWVAYPDQERVDAKDLVYLPEVADAKQYVVEHSTEQQSFDYNAIERVERALAPLVEQLIERHMNLYPDTHKGLEDERER